ncbi:sodium:proton exchanger [Oceanicola sp. 22II-s10i]|uniref:calcium/sodium antiporter n=1 Tax=Oceanicola sp. 22II-s10i TaxID=1317116 RepID=UPI000B51EFCD|nr:calcium/sodium antiporter [Oceanicola sp. 22II-s10i]OWU85553.1 sodium:proton exchanger [Oceanicola sp. 22II-s10i]
MLLLQAAGLATLGLVVLVIGGDLLVRGAVNLALRLGIPALIVSLTVVAFGTSAPELLVSIDAVVSGKPDLALGNVIGSNIANILLVLGLPAIISGLHMSKVDTRRSFVVMIAATVVFIGLALFGVIGLTSGLILLAILALTLFDQFRSIRKARRAATDTEDVEGADPDMPWWKIAVFLVLGLIGLPLGADLLVENAAIIARAFGVSDAVIGLTLVALGTSLPELATTVAAALRRQADVAIGNVIGSNLFNLLGIIGITATIGAVPVAPTIMRFDLWVMLAASVLIAPFVLGRRDMGRGLGIAFVAAYLVYVGYVLI